MPIEIKELHIRIAVNASRTDSQSGNREVASAGVGTRPDDEKDAMVAQCVEQVMQILENKTER